MSLKLMRSTFRAVLQWTIGVLLMTLATATPTVACPFCLAPPQTFSERFLLSDVVVVAELVRFEVLNDGTLPKSTLRIRKVLRDKSGLTRASGLVPGRSTVMFSEAPGRPGDLFLLFGDLAESLDGGTQTFATTSDTDTSAVTTASFNTPSRQMFQKVAFETPGLLTWSDFDAISPLAMSYLEQIPDRSIPAPERLAFFNAYLESSDPVIAEDAWAEFGGAAYQDVLAVRHLFRREDLCCWIADPEMNPERLGLYGLMLGLCGGSEDAEFLLDSQRSPETGDFRFGGEGLLAGYLLLTGERGLIAIQTTLNSPDVSDTYRHALIQALQFFWSYEPDVISPSQIANAMRSMLRSESMREIAIINLSRWEDWESLDLLVQLFETDYRNDVRCRKAVLQFAELCADSTGKGETHLATAERARQFIEIVRTANPELLKPVSSDFRAPQ